MASLYKKPVIMVDPKTGQKVKTKSRKWWCMYRDALGKLCRVPLAIDKIAAQAMLNKIVQNVERELAGLVDPSHEQRKRPLSMHLAEYKHNLENKDITFKQIQESTTQISKIIKANK